MPIGIVHLSDFLRAARELAADEEMVAAIARLLKLEGSAAPGVLGFYSDVPSAANLGERLRGPALAGAASEAEPIAPFATPAVTPEPEAPDNAPELPARLVPMDRAGSRVPALAIGELMPRRTGLRKRPGFVPLFPARQVRAMLSRSLARKAQIGEIDIESLVEKLAGRQAVHSVPRFSEPTLAGGVQLLIDRSPTFSVYAEDAYRLRGDICRVVGGDRVQVLYFARLPQRGAGAGGVPEWLPYLEHHLPPHGTVVAVLTDLGLRSAGVRDIPAPPEAWLSLQAALRKRECPMVVFTPYRRSRFPRKIVRELMLVEWDWRTDISSIHALARKGLSVQQ